MWRLTERSVVNISPYQRDLFIAQSVIGWFLAHLTQVGILLLIIIFGVAERLTSGALIKYLLAWLIVNIFVLSL